MARQESFDLIFLKKHRIVWIFIYLMSKDVEHFLRVFCLGIYSIYYWITCSFDYQFLIFFVHFGDQPSVQCGLVKFFSHSVGCCFSLLTMSFDLQKHLSIRRSHILIVAFRVCATGVRNWSLVQCFKYTYHFLFHEVHCGWLYVSL